MARRVAAAARESGLDQDGVGIVVEALRVADETRAQRLDDDHDPRYLHPGRTALILLDDVKLGDPVALAVGVTFDSSDAALEPELAHELGLGQVAGLREELPRAGEDALLGLLIEHEGSLLNVLIAERLDHLRHLHLGPVDDAARAAYAEASESYLPASTRAHPTLHRRLSWWVRRFSARFGNSEG